MGASRPRSCCATRPPPPSTSARCSTADPIPLDVARVRAAFPSLALGAAHFDGPGGSQVPTSVARGGRRDDDRRAGQPRHGHAGRAARRRVVAGARQAIADLLGGDAGGVVFGRSMTQVTYDLSRALAKRAGDPATRSSSPGSITTANIRPWVQAAEAARRDGALGGVRPRDRRAARRRRRGAAVRPHPAGRGHRRVEPARHPAGLPAIADAAHAVGALVYVDGVHLTPHAPVDVAALGADFFVCSPYKFFGPHLGAAVADPALLRRSTRTSCCRRATRCPSGSSSARCPYELLAGTTATVDFLADLVPRRRATPPERVLASMAAVEAHEDRLFARLLDGLARIDGVTLHGAPARRTPTALFSVDGRDAARGVRAARRARRQRPGRPLLRDRGVALARSR